MSERSSRQLSAQVGCPYKVFSSQTQGSKEARLTHDQHNIIWFILILWISIYSILSIATNISTELNPKHPKKVSVRNNFSTVGPFRLAAAEQSCPRPSAPMSWSCTDLPMKSIKVRIADEQLKKHIESQKALEICELLIKRLWLGEIGYNLKTRLIRFDLLWILHVSNMRNMPVKSEHFASKGWRKSFSILNHYPWTREHWNRVLTAMSCYELLACFCFLCLSHQQISLSSLLSAPFSSFQCFIFLVFFHEAAQQRPHQQAVPRTQAPRPGRWCCPVEIYDARGMTSHMSHVSHVLTSIPPIGHNSIQFFSMPCNWHPKRHRTSRSW